ncbi:MAG TPA: TIGR04211 family SH3 domain-containing protein [Myxococcota bacterium]|nr:TIGR04211 family SH3 domain-containing protein [Myxococcota bacterium]
MPAPSARAALRLCLVAAAVASAGPARAEDAWVRGAALNLRAGPGPEHAVLAAVPPGERLDVLESKGEWMRVRRSDGTSGWIARTYLVQDAPPAARIAELEAQVAQLEQQLDGAARDAESARRDGEERAAENAAHADQMARVRRENDTLRAGARWPEWITGALILSTGIALGAAVRGVSGRRRQSRLRL